MKGMDMLVFAGQSNMQGMAERLSETASVRGALEYRFLEDKLVPLANPVGENISYDLKAGYDVAQSVEETDDRAVEQWLAEHALGRTNWGHTNLVPSFCRAYIKETNRSVIAVHTAKSATCIADWQAGGALFDAMITKVKSGIRKVESVGLGRLYFVWLQGENDALAGTSKEEYLRLFTAFKNAVKEMLPLERFAVIRVGNFAMDKRDSAIQAAQEEACKTDKDFYMLTRETETCGRIEKYGNPACRGHFSALGLERIGKVAGKELGKLVNRIGGRKE